MSPRPGFEGLRVASFESRKAEEMQRMLERSGAQAHVSPSMREVSLDAQTEAQQFAQRLTTGDIDLLIFMTGVGIRHLLSTLEGTLTREQFTAALGKVTTVVRGPKPAAVLRELGLKPDLTVPEPNTWRELLETLDRESPVSGKRVVVQEYGLPNVQLVEGLTSRGASVETVRIYRWDLPEDVGPLEANIRAVATGERDVVLFTSRPQIMHVEAVAGRLGLAREFAGALDRIVVASIGPTTSETLREHGWPVDMEPTHPKMGHLVTEAAAQSAQLLAAKQQRGLSQPAAEPHVTAVTGANRITDADALHNSPFMKACRLEPSDRVPIWLMRQAGRYMAEYRQVREKVGFLELCKNPTLCAEVMLTAVDVLGVDAAIIFADLLPILEPMGLDLEFTAGDGPQIHNPIRSAGDVDRVIELEDVGVLDFVMETVRQTRAGLPAEIPLIGFAGAPFTLASYAIEGAGSRNYIHTKGLMYQDESAWHELMERLARSVSRYLIAQVEAGAQVVQIFDSWVGCLGPEDYRRYVLPHTKSIVDAVSVAAPVINFAAGNPMLLPLLSEAGGAVIGIDWRIRLDDAWDLVGHDVGVQGNLDPVSLFSSPAQIRARAQEVLDQAAGRPGHIFNLGHGILPQTPVDHVKSLIDAVHELGQARNARD